MADNKPPKNPELDPRVMARRQKDMDGFIEKYDRILEGREKKYADDLLKKYKKIGRNITEEIRAIYKQLQDANGVPITQEPIPEAKLRNMKYEIARLQKLQQQIIQIVGTDDQVENLKRNLAYEYTSSYYFHAFGLEQAAKVAVNVPLLTEAHVMGILANPWLPDGATYSDRLRANTVYLAQKMEQAVTEAVGAGWDINKTARRIGDIAGEGYYNAVRLARTEINRAAAQGASHSFMQNSDILDGKRWNATLDARTAPKDAENDGEIFELSYDTPENPGRAGERIPNHPNCRCKWTPVLSSLGVSQKERIARGEGDSTTEFGERIYTKARTYKEYAEERGLPDMDERLANDNPRSYLRRGEDMDAYNLPSGNITSSVAGAAAASTAAGATAPEVDTETFTPATTIEEAESFAAGVLDIPKVRYKDFDLDIVNELNEGIFTTVQEIPELKGLLDQLVNSKAKTYYGLMRSMPTNKKAGDTKGKYDIRLSSTLMGKKDVFDKALQRDIKSNFHPQGFTSGHIVSHELAHAVERLLAFKRKGINKDTSFTTKDWNAYINESRLDAKQVTDEALARMGLPPAGRDSYEAMKYLGHYAFTNKSELFAQAMADAIMSKEPGEFSKHVLEVTKDKLRK